MESLKNWGVVINPKAGNVGVKRALIYKKELEGFGLQGDFCFTDRRGHASLIVKGFLEKGIRKILVVGGDGTLNEAVNGICGFSSDKVLVAVLPVGTGNDWCRHWKIGSNIKDCVDLIKSKRTALIDVGSVQLDNSNEISYFLNSFGVGLDARTVEYANVMKSCHCGVLGYVSALAAAVLAHRSSKAVVHINGEKIFDRGLYTISVGNGPYTGGGLLQTPDADPTDGFFNALIVREPSLPELANGLYQLTKAKLHECVISTYLKAMQVGIHCPSGVKMEMDGICLGVRKNAEIKIVPQAFSLVVP